MCVCRLSGLHQEWPGPVGCVARVGHGVPEGWLPESGAGEVRPLPEAPGGPRPAHPRPTAAPGDPAAPGGQHPPDGHPHGNSFISLPAV